MSFKPASLLYSLEQRQKIKNLQTVFLNTGKTLRNFVMSFLSRLAERKAAIEAKRQKLLVANGDQPPRASADRGMKVTPTSLQAEACLAIFWSSEILSA